MANPILEGGFFLIIITTAFFLMFYSFKANTGRGYLKILSMALFSILAIFIGSGYQVAFSSTQTTINPATNETWNQTTEQVILPGGEDSSWYAWLFSGFAMANIVFLLRDYQGGS